MTDKEIDELIKAYDFDSETAKKVGSICREVERTTRHNFFSIIQHANNAATGREVTSRELDRMIWNHGHKKKESP